MSKGAPPDPTISTYYVGVHFALCHGPIDYISQVIVDTSRLAWEGTWASGSIYINKPNLFGGSDREGGVVGTVDVAMGETTQGTNNYLVSVLGAAIPAFRGVVSVILNQVLVGNNYYMKPWGFMCTRVHKRKNGIVQWQDALAEPLSGLMNPAHIIRECLTDPTWGLGHSEGTIDETDFLASAQTCYNEGLAFGFLWKNETSVQDFIVEVAKHAQGVVYENRKTGKFHFKLTRKLATTEGLLLLNETNIKEVSSFGRKSLNELVSSYTVKFLDNTTRKDNSYTVTDTSVMQRQGASVTKTVTYEGVTSLAMAQKLAIRDIGQLSVPIYATTFICDRTAEDLNVGDPFLYSWPDDLPDTLTMRVISLDLGTATNGAITITAMQDVFSAPDVIYSTPVGSLWLSSINAPSAVATRSAYELPYYLIARAKGDTTAQGIADTSSYIGIAGVSPTQDAISAGLWTTTGSTYVRASNMDFCYKSVLGIFVTKTMTTFTVASTLDIELLTLNSYVQMGSELMQVTAFSSSSLTVVRGVLDTVPETHEIGAIILGVQDFYGADQIEYTIGETIHVKLTTKTAIGELELASAPYDDVVVDGRLHMPYPPGNFKVNGSYWPTTISTGASLGISFIVLTWASRNRLLQTTATMTGYYDGNVTTEASVTYSGQLIRVSDNLVIDSFSGETGLTRTLSSTIPVTYPEGYLGQVRLELWSVRAGFTSFQTVTHTFTLTA